MRFNCEGTVGLPMTLTFSLGTVDVNPQVRAGTITSILPEETYEVVRVRRL